MVTHDPKAAEPRAQDRAARKRRAGRLTRASDTRMFVPLPRPQATRLRHKLRTTLTIDRHRRRDHGVRPAAHDRRRVVCGRRGDVVGAPRHAQRHLARVLAAAHLCAEDPAGAGRDRRCRGRTGSAASTSPSATSSRSSRSSAATYLDMYPEFRADAEERKAFLVDRQRRHRRPQARRPVRLEDRRPDTDTRDDLSGHVDVHAARRSTTAPTPRPTRRSSSSTGNI